MRSSAAILILALLVGVGALPPAAQEAPAEEAPQEAPKIDPFTGQPVAQAAEEPPETPAGPDLGAVNEMILEGSYEEAEGLLEALLEEFPEHPTVLLTYGEVLVAQRKLEPAIDALERCAAVAPESPRLHFQLGAALAQLGQTERAIEEFAKELEYNKDPKVLMLAHLNRTALFGQSRNWEAAAAELEAVIALDPTQVQAYGDLVSFYLQAGDVDAATDALSRGAAAGFSSASHYYSLGARLYRDERYEEASNAFNQALQVDPSFARAERSLGATYEKLGLTDEAALHFRRYLELAPEAPDAESIAEKIRETDS